MMKEREGEMEWDIHLHRNQSVVIDTFQGQFKSTVSPHFKFTGITSQNFVYTLDFSPPMKSEVHLLLLNGPYNNFRGRSWTFDKVL